MEGDDCDCNGGEWDVDIAPCLDDKLSTLLTTQRACQLNACNGYVIYTLEVTLLIGRERELLFRLESYSSQCHSAILFECSGFARAEAINRQIKFTNRTLNRHSYANAVVIGFCRNDMCLPYINKATSYTTQDKEYERVKRGYSRCVQSECKIEIVQDVDITYVQEGNEHADNT